MPFETKLPCAAKNKFAGLCTSFFFFPFLRTFSGVTFGTSKTILIT